MAYNYPRRQAGGAGRPQLHDFNHIYKVLATSILETISPTRCVACDVPGDVLCPSCASSLPFIDLSLACPRCGAPYGRALCTECPMPGSEEALLHPEEAFPFARARATLSFEGGAKKIIRTYKDGDELRLDAVIASLLCAAIRGRMRQFGQTHLSHFLTVPVDNETDWSDTSVSSSALEDWSHWASALAYVPASPEAVRRRDFDHMERVAIRVAARTGLPLAHLLTSERKTHDQRELGRGERFANRNGSFSLAVDTTGPIPRRIILIDDVFTTGATLSAASRVLLDGGAEEVRAVTCCRVW